MKKINILKFILFAFVFCVLATACEKSNETELTEPIVTTSTKTSTTKITTATNTTIATTSTTKITTTTNTTTTAITDTITTETTENAEKLADKQLVKEILTKYCDYPEEWAEEDADGMINTAEPYSPVGTIHSEEDAKEKGRAVLLAYMGQDFIDRIEADFKIYEGQELKIERDYPPYTVTYCEEYDTWIIFTHPLSGKVIEEDAPILGVATPGEFPYVILRGNDGKVLAIF